MSEFKDFKCDVAVTNVYRLKGLRDAVQTDTDTYQQDGAHGT